MISRRTVRVLLVDEHDQVLLLKLIGDWWITVGGGIEAGESPEQAAVREIAEETGLVVDRTQIGPQVWTGRRIFRWRDTVYDQTESFHLVRCTGFDPYFGGLMDEEIPEVQGSAWWSVDELMRTSENFRPVQLPALLPRVLGGPWQGAPVDLGTERAI